MKRMNGRLRSRRSSDASSSLDVLAVPLPALARVRVLLVQAVARDGGEHRRLEFGVGEARRS
jgi:hypothetical protein